MEEKRNTEFESSRRVVAGDTWHGTCQLSISLGQDCIAKEVKYMQASLGMVDVTRDCPDLSFDGRC